ncbi:MAG: glucose-6-phosphate isomerase [Gemmatimonadetes bacterium]|nr:glucose-6-phosphate isomerase [Gemmatimonadota bacterium]
MTARPRGPVLDHGNALHEGLGGAGVDPKRLEGDLADRFRAAHAAVEERRRTGEMGFFRLPGDEELAARSRAAADDLGRDVDALVVIGIGGSALGLAAIRDALLPAGWNELDDEARRGRPRLYILANPDPDTLTALLPRIDPERTLFNVVSKSGTTAETLAQLMVIWSGLEAALGADGLPRRLVVTTSSGRGPLAELAASRGLRLLPIPEAVGGRFSVLSPVGAFPASVLGVDIDELLMGAREAAARSAHPTLAENPAGMLATLLHLADTELGHPVQLFMPYADGLRGFAYWAQQLWAESLGKALDTEGRLVETGPTPLPAFGATDQHSILQLMMEGPRDKVVVFLAPEAPRRDIVVPPVLRDYPALSYLGGHTLFELLQGERRATAEALRRAGRMNMTITFERLDARSLGGLFMLFQIAVAYAGALYGVDPLDQPGVELGKVLTGGLLGRSGCPDPEIPPVASRWRM